ncbi:hypothetical protein [Nocardioides sp. GXZ039]|uniref:hypothetical protein n=1 Tax=Nocardioides sp. GXZ039 TaxID=3136018 RepID=UPI0030F42336
MGSPSVTVAHHKGRRLLFIPELGSRRASWNAVTTLTGGLSEIAQIASSVSATLRRFDATYDRAWVENVDATGLRAVTPDELVEVRRPVSYVGMGRYIGTVVVPTTWADPRAVWFESFNERHHYLDLLLGGAVSQMSTQSLRLEWPTADGIRVHYPDAFLLIGTRRLLVDVTTTRRVSDERAMSTFRLTSATARELGWEYQLLTEMPPQRARNLRFLRACQSAGPAVAAAWAAVSERSGWPRQLDRLAHDLADELGDWGTGLGAAWHLLATAQLHTDLDNPIRPETWIDTRQEKQVQPWRIQI